MAAGLVLELAGGGTRAHELELEQLGDAAAHAAAAHGLDGLDALLERVERAGAVGGGGTGLGLAIVKHIVQYHNGKIDVTSIKDKGSAFKISIPE